jgi:hypothetical protein
MKKIHNSNLTGTFYCTYLCYNATYSYDLNRRALVNLRDFFRTFRTIATETYTDFRRKIGGTRDKNTAVSSVVSAWGESRGQWSSEFTGLTRRRSEVQEGCWREFVQVPPPQIAKRIKDFTTEGLWTESFAILVDYLIQCGGMIFHFLISYEGNILHSFLIK